MNNKLKTHCPTGHEYDKYNTYIWKAGPYLERHCRECHKIQQAKYYAKKHMLAILDNPKNFLREPIGIDNDNRTFQNTSKA